MSSSKSTFKKRRLAVACKTIYDKDCRLCKLEACEYVENDGEKLSVHVAEAINRYPMMYAFYRVHRAQFSFSKSQKAVQ